MICITYVPITKDIIIIIIKDIIQNVLALGNDFKSIMHDAWCIIDSHTSLGYNQQPTLLPASAP